MSRLLLIGYGSEGTFAHFRDFVVAEGVDHEVLDLAALRTARDLTVTEAPGDLVVSIDDDVVHLGEFSAIYTRAYWYELGSPGRGRALGALMGALQGFLEHTPAIVANRPSAGASNVNKLGHLAYLREVGLTHPETHIFGDPELARSVLTADGSWISKSCSSVKTRAVAVDEALYARLDRLAQCPSLFQRRIRGADVRVTVVGTECIAERIVAQQVDYRYRDPAGSRAQFSPCEVPPEIARACVAYCERAGLVFAGIDFKIAEGDGTWFALEANPMPGYEPYDRRLGHRISRALLRWLTPPPAEPDVEPFVVAARRPAPSPFG